VNFRRSVIIAELWGPEVARSEILWAIFAFFGKTTPYGKIFKILFRIFSPPDRSTLLLSNVVKFVRREIGEITHYLSDQQNFGCLSNCRYCADRAQNVTGPVPNNVLTVLQFSSKLVHFWRSYRRTREHRFLPGIIFPRWDKWEQNTAGVCGSLKQRNPRLFVCAPSES